MSRRVFTATKVNVRVAATLGSCQTAGTGDTVAESPRSHVYDEAT